MSEPTSNQDAATKFYVDNNSGISQTNADSRYYLNTTALNNILAPIDSLSLNSQKITNLANPSINTDAATKEYVDS